MQSAQAAQGVARWGQPTSLSDIEALFLDHLDGTSTSTPFSPEPLDPESTSIVSNLRRLVQKGWWTVASQPAVDALPSSDPIVGWGPRGGYVFQKAFVECFCEKSSVEWLENKVKKMVGKSVVSFYAANKKVWDQFRLGVTLMHIINLTGRATHKRAGRNPKCCYLGRLPRARNCTTYNN